MSICQGCNFHNKEEDLFCQHCGLNLDDFFQKPQRNTKINRIKNKVESTRKLAFYLSANRSQEENWLLAEKLLKMGIKVDKL